jgi:Flp pilus assembly protein TadG
MRIRDAQRGAIAIELVIMTPAVVMFFAVMVIAGRITLAQQAAEAAAFDAARSASLARSASAAEFDAVTAATTSFESQGLVCITLEVDANTEEFAIDPPEPAVVQVTVSCLVQLADVALPGMPGELELTGQFTSPLDRYREREGS